MIDVIKQLGWRRPVGVALLGFLCAVLASPGDAGAHAYLEQSEPAANAVVPDTPAEVRMTFTEPLEPSYTEAVLYAADGSPITTEPAGVNPDDGYELILPLPDDLPLGTYTVQWSNISTADGHPEVGFFSFTIGEPANVTPVTPPADAGDTTGGANRVTQLGRWLGVLGIVAAVGSLCCWCWVIRPPAQALPEEMQNRLSRRVAWFARGSILLSLLGVALALVTQARDAAGELTGAAVVEFVRESHTGEMLALRLGLLLLFGALLASRIPWEPQSGMLDTLLAQAVGLGVLFQFALLTHATAQEQGQPAAVAAEWLHLVAAAVWVGGLLTLAAALTGLKDRIGGQERRALLAEVITRFSTLAICAVLLVSLSGLYAGWVHLGSLSNLTGSSYGCTLLIKLALTVPLVGLGALNLLVIGPALRRSAGRERDFSRTVRLEAVLGAGVLLVAAILASTAPPQDTAASQALQGGTQVDLIAADAHTILNISPGTVGQNEYMAEVHLLGGTFPSDTQVLLRIARDDQISGIREVVLDPEQPLDGTQESARFSAAGAELSVVGDWDLEIIIRRQGEADARATGLVNVGDSAPAAAATEPARRGFTSPLAAPLMLLAALVIVVAVLSLRHRRGRPAGLGPSTAKPSRSE